MRVEFPDDEANALDLARTLSEIALWAAHTGRLDDAERSARRAVSELLALDGDAQDEVGFRGELARARCRLALVHARRGADDEARATLARVAAAADAPMGGAGRRVDVHLEMSLVYRALAEHAVEAGRDEDALADLDAALTLVKEGGDRPPPPQIVGEIAGERAPILRRLGRTEEADRAEAEGRRAQRGGAPPPRSPEQGPPLPHHR